MREFRERATGTPWTATRNPAGRFSTLGPAPDCLLARRGSGHTVPNLAGLVKARCDRSLSCSQAGHPMALRFLARPAPCIGPANAPTAHQTIPPAPSRRRPIPHRQPQNLTSVQAHPPGPRKAPPTSTPALPEAHPTHPLGRHAASRSPGSGANHRTVLGHQDPPRASTLVAFRALGRRLWVGLLFVATQAADVVRVL